MARKKSPTLTEGELKIMKVLWRRGEASVRQVTSELSRARKVAYSTALTMLRVLEEKGYIEHRKEGRAFVYFPLLDRQQARTRALKYVLRSFFNNSPAALAQSLIEEEEIDLLELQQLMDEVERSKDEEST